MKRYYLIINAHAGKDAWKKAIQQVLDSFTKYSVKFDHVFTEKPGHAIELAQKVSETKYDVVVAVGGDGTVNEVANGLLGRGIVMGVIPIGSGNGFARDSKISINPKKAVKELLKGKSKFIDVWQINNNIFLCTAGLGFDANVARNMTLSVRRGRWEYVRLTLMESIFFKPLEVAFNVGGQLKKESVFLISFANAGQYGNNAYISPGAKTDDGLLDIVVIRPVAKMLYPILGLALFLRIIHKFGFYKRYRANSLEIYEASSNLCHIDGESVEIDFPVQIGLLKDQLKIQMTF
ncbi:diacylglycerol kinase family lipid kinase [Draconibacterium sp.]|nr:diacylglycerol kinase family lipid kinase [Draconibacterium sp.]